MHEMLFPGLILTAVGGGCYMSTLVKHRLLSQGGGEVEISEVAIKVGMDGGSSAGNGGKLISQVTCTYKLGPVLLLGQPTGSTWYANEHDENGSAKCLKKTTSTKAGDYSGWTANGTSNSLQPGCS
ncbi:Hypothetical predicted protein [Paramuricea clavata]|uniref:Uncharacterized protein n=1 Tax=Paramuricea clavata TaxID=317549 RepID=A0A6S7I1S4_PARCT|nr:Hypothetical predicted protein [Paramuricea clavata]